MHTTLYQLTTALYGKLSKGIEDRRGLAGALLNLHMASITTSDYDAAGMERPGRWVDVHLVRRIHYGEQLQALQDNQPVSAVELGALRGETLAIYIDDWLIARLQRGSSEHGWTAPCSAVSAPGSASGCGCSWSHIRHFARKRPTHEGAVIELTGRKSIRRGIARIRGVDDRYVLLEFVPRQAGESDLLRVIRRRRHPSTGADSFEPVGLLG